MLQSEVLLRHILRFRGEAVITLTGISMEPLLREGDRIRIVKSEYKIGDILVFPYKNNTLLAHRLVGERAGRLLCKGDNAFRVEDIEPDAVLGKVTAVLLSEEWREIPSIPPEIIAMSLELGQRFRKNAYNAERTATESLYAEFRQKLSACASFREDINGKEVNACITP